MAKKKKSEKLQGAMGFETYYSQLFGIRWEKLKNALLQESKPEPWQTSSNNPPYYLDSASVLAASSLPLENAEKILDMCAAPGGKTLVISSFMNENATLVANERSKERMMRLKRVADEFMIPSVRERVQITCGDGAKLCLNKQEYYDSILLDAPCSSERHVLTSPAYLNEWSPARIKTLAITQWSLLSSAYRLLKRGGYLVYATCALSPLENDKIVERLEKKFKDVQYFSEIEWNNEKITKYFSGKLPIPEKTDYGFHVLPDTACGAGPLYFSVIYKKTIDE